MLLLVETTSSSNRSITSELEDAEAVPLVAAATLRSSCLAFFPKGALQES